MSKNNASPIRSRPMRLGANHSSKGFTLIELLLVLALTSALLGGTIGLTSIARGSNQLAKQNLLKRQEIRRFADDIRRDIRLAESSNVADGELVLSNTSLDWRIVYQVESNSSVSRSVEKMNNPTVMRDDYTIGISARIEIQWLDGINAVRWTVTEMDSPNQPIQIMASQRSSQ